MFFKIFSFLDNFSVWAVMVGEFMVGRRLIIWTYEHLC